MQLTQEKFDQGRLALERFEKLIQVRYRPLLRAITENPLLQVQPHSSMAFTDNKTVWLPVPFALGDETLEHDKTYCGRRDPVTLKMLCPFCNVEDEVDGVVLHESAHITEQSFEKIKGPGVRKLLEGVYKPALDALDPDHRKKIVAKAMVASDAMELANILDRWLPFATNVVEDIYVNRRLFGYREGSELPLQIFSRSIFEEGSKQADGSISHWRDGELSAQAIISAYLVGQNMADLGSCLNPDADLTSDPGVVALVDSIPSSCPVEQRLEIAMKLLLHLRELGFCPPTSDSAVTPPQPPSQSKDQEAQPPSPGAEQQESEPEQGEGEDGGEEPQDGESQSEGGSDTESEEGDDTEAGDGQGESSDEQGESEESGKGSGDADDGEESEEASDGGDQGEPADDGEASGDGEGEQSSEGEAGEESSQSSKGDAASDDAGKDDPQPLTEAELEEQIRRAKELLTYVMGHEDTGPTGQSQENRANKRAMERILKQKGFDHPSEVVTGISVKDQHDETYERLTKVVHRVEVPRSTVSSSLARLRVVFASNRKTGLERSLKRGPRLDKAHLARAGYEDEPRIFGRRSIPKSRDWFVLVGLDFSGSTQGNGADHAEKMAGHAIGDLLHQMGIRFSMYAHTACRTQDGSPGRDLEIVVIKGPDENWKTKGVQEMLFAQRGRSTNLDGHSLEYYRKLIVKERATDKLLMYFTDGEMPNANFDEELRLLQENIAILRRNQVNLLGIGYRTDSPKRHGLDTIQYDKPDDVKAIVKGLEDRLLR